jgi:DNA-binding SARP family transcriptional activator/DNA-binding XRE family transcriptional regulator
MIEGLAMGTVTAFGQLMRRYRTERGLTQEQLAGAADMSLAAVRDLEQGRRQRPRRESLARLTAALQLAPAQASMFVRASLPAAPEILTGLSANPWTGLRLQVFGPLAASHGGGLNVQLGPPRQRAVLGLLALTPNHLVHREMIIDALWGGDPPATATSLVQAYVSRLRRALLPECARRERTILDAVGASYRLAVTEDELDLLAFRQLSGSASRAAAAGDAMTAFTLYRRAMETCGGTLLADIDMLRGHLAETEVAAERSAVLLRYAVVAVSIGRHDQVLPHLRAMTRLEPLNEQAHAHLMIVLAGLGQQAAALHEYQELSERLDSQLGVRPGPQLADTYLRVLRQEIPPAQAVGIP